MVGFCKKADEFRLEDLDLCDDVFQFIEGKNPAEFLNDVRNKRHFDDLWFQLYDFYRGEYAYMGEKKADELALDLSYKEVDNISQKLIELGFVREELDNYENTPEGYFMFEYWEFLPKTFQWYCDKIFYKGRLLSSGREVDNLEYETYVYSELKMEQVFSILKGLLPKEQYEVLRMDVETEGRTSLDSDQKKRLVMAKKQLKLLDDEQISSWIKVVRAS